MAESSSSMPSSSTRNGTNAISPLLILPTSRPNNIPIRNRREVLPTTSSRLMPNHKPSVGLANSRAKFGSNVSLASNLSTSSLPETDPLNQNQSCRWRGRDQNVATREPVYFCTRSNNTCRGSNLRGRWSAEDAPSESQEIVAPRIRHFGYRYLNELSQKEPHEIIVEVTKVTAPFDTYLAKTEIDPDWLFLMLKIIRIVCLSDFKGNRCEILDKLCNSQFLTLVWNYLGDVGLETKPTTVLSLPTFVSDLCVFYNGVIDTLPSMAVEKDLKKTIMKTKLAVDSINRHQAAVKVDEEVEKRLDVLVAKFEDHLKVVKERLPKEKVHSYLERIADCAPPEDFRELSLYPTYEDLARKRLGFVRPNKVSGSYDSVEHYLDVQFRLLREDFIDPLRNGLRKYTQSILETDQQQVAKKSKFKYNNLRIYPDSRFVQMKNSKSHHLGILVDFDPKAKLKHLKWERSKRFMNGSLLMFTDDNFHTFFYGTVLERNIGHLMAGQILVALTENANVNKNIFSRAFVMAESEVFFNPYYLVMKLLKELDESTFPMKRYIVEGSSATEYPSYMNDFVSWKFDSNFSVSPTDIDGWPTADQLGLDAFQYRAFKAALTQDFCVIQGPPGTGKTFLGLKIVNTILSNVKSSRSEMINGTLEPETGVSMSGRWSLRLQSLNPRRMLSERILKLPILVVCYTNHALDQFLEGMLQFTKEIVRIGGQSRSEIMQKYNLRGQQNKRCAVSWSMTETRNAIKTIRGEISKISVARKSVQASLGILSADLLQLVVPKHIRFLVKTDDDLLAWLLDDNFIEQQSKYNFENFNYVQETQVQNASGELNEAADADENEDIYIVDEDDIFRDKEDEIDFKNNYSTTLEKLGMECQRLINELRSMEGHNVFYTVGQSLKQTICQKIGIFYQLKNNLKNRSRCNGGEIEFLLRRNVSRLPSKSKWAIYWSWVSELYDHLAKQLEKLEGHYRNKMVQYEEYKQLEDLNVVQNADIVGMTTTGAAAMNLMLKSLKPAVVVVEEAAEVLEAHIVTSLTKECQHVILIGDHEQLKPSSAVYELSKNYNINVSLFERMLKNGMNCPVLNVQHRMRPEISCLITPLIYPDLKNHESVLKFPPIDGIMENVFFIDHTSPEQVNDDTMSKQNIHEAEFVIRLARYLVLRGYQAEKITILTTYTGQMFLLRDLQKNEFLTQHVKCVVVDKYQGEENDIILLSLVRSNEEGKIGFLSIKNRVCVALSRAKKGFYMIGNMDCLTKNSELWQNIKQTLQQNNRIGLALHLRCSIHDKSTFAVSAEDFKNVREGGCDLYCKELMECGHYCPALCHPTNRDHKETRCREPCKNTCARNLHPCPSPCYEECPPCSVQMDLTLPCQHTKRLRCSVQEHTYLCQEVVDDVSPLCNHAVKRYCHQSAKEAICSFPCEDRLECGHVCARTCHKGNDPDHVKFNCQKPCERLNNSCSKAHVCPKLCFEECGMCTIKVDFILPCSHESVLPCSIELAKVKCVRKCEKVCPNCNKKCRKDCWQNCNPCNHEVKKIIPECGHEVTIKCSMEPNRIHCRQKCNSVAPCGHKCRSMCCKPCGTEKCTEIVKLSIIKPLCGHESVYVFCYKQNDVSVLQMNAESFLYYCKEPCNAILECGDVCSGNCGSCWQGRLHWTCQQQCGKTLICGHSCKFPCSKLCPPCNEPCTNRCPHSYCPKKCGVPCVPCKERCEWRCKHSKCTRKCSDLCNREPCYKPCSLKIPSCGHPCIGFCGEPCPPVCRTCNPEVTEIMFGYEDEPDARFVLLVDCQHTIESRALDQHLSSALEGDEIVMKVCPLCKTSITKTLRYMNYVKQTYKHILNVKKKIFGDYYFMGQKVRELTSQFSRLMEPENLNVFSEITELAAFLRSCFYKLSSSSKKYPLSQHQLSTITYYYEVFDTIISRKKDFEEERYGPTFGPILPEGGIVPYGLQRPVAPRRGLIRYRPIPVDRDRFRQPHELVQKIEFIDKERVFDFLKNLVSRLQRTYWSINYQRIMDFNDELRRYHAMINYSKLRSCSSYSTIKSKEEISTLCTAVECKLFGCIKFTEEMGTDVKDLLTKLQTELKSSDVLDLDEKRMINAAMSQSFGGLTSGQWYTCSNGHYYCITECGMARQTATCPECNETIGQGSTYRQRRSSKLT